MSRSAAKRGDSWWAELTTPSWADGLDDDDGLEWFIVEFLVSPRDSWRRNGSGQPAFGAGLSFSYRGRRKFPAVLDSDQSTWPELLERRGISVGATGDGRGRCFKTLYLAEVMANANNLHDQAAAVASWAAAAVSEVAALTPPSPETDRSGID